MPSRRQFLKFGLGGGLLLAAAGAARAQRPFVAASGAEALAVLDAGDRVVLAAIVPALLAGTGEAAGQLDAVIGSVDRAVAGLPPHLQAEVKQLFALLGSWVGRRWLAGVRAPWSEASRAEVAAFLERWRFSGWRLQQQAYQALHELVFAAWYARPGSWPAIGYPGPPEVR
ncbi:MAG: hypothetical protein U1F45_12105 [Burkholderiales bacterium]